MTDQIGSSYGSDYYLSHYGRLVEDQNYYKLISEYWKYVLFVRNSIDTTGLVLDYGGGIGQVSDALPNISLSDPSEFATEFSMNRGKKVINSLDEIPHNCFDIVLSSHSLEHSPYPADDLIRFIKYVKKPNGKLVLLIPAEVEMYIHTKPLKSPRLQPDLHDQHFQCWTFQTITNLLAYCGWRSVRQEKVYGPFLLNTLSKYLTLEKTIETAYWLGKLKKNYPSLLTIAEPFP